MGLERSIDTDDIYKTVNNHESSQLTEQFNELWEKEKYSNHPSIYNVIRKIYAKRIIGLCILYTIIDIVSRYAIIASKHIQNVEFSSYFFF